MWFGLSLSAFGVVYLALFTNSLTSLLAVLTLLIYLFLYTPLKRTTPLCTLVGAIPGAAPTLIGWAAARGRLHPDAWVLWAIVFLWQFPHFMAIAWMYREDYTRAGFRMLPSNGLRDWFVICQSFGVSLLLVPVALIPAVSGEFRLRCAVGILTLNFIFIYYAARFALRRSNVTARGLLVASIIYLPLVFFLTVLSKK
jgi:heme o synthase